jgi:hypothetical protein
MQDDAVAGVLERFDGPGAEEHPALMAGAVDVEHEGQPTAELDRC